MGHVLQMIRVDAGTIPTQMVQLSNDRTSHVLVGDPVGLLNSTVLPISAVPQTVQASNPLPATRSVEEHLRQESLW